MVMDKRLFAVGLATLLMLVLASNAQTIRGHCGGMVLGSADQGRLIVSHGSYPDDYRNSFTCEFSIKAPRGKSVVIVFEQFHLEPDATCRFDFLTVRDGARWLTSQQNANGKLCGDSLPEPLTSRTSQLDFHFRTDSSIQHSGFAFRFVFCESSCCHVTFLTGQRRSGTVTSQNWPSSYAANQRCTHHLLTESRQQRIKLAFSRFDLEGGTGCNFDSVQIRDGISPANCTSKRFCGTTRPPTFVSTGNQLSVMFKSDSALAGDGYSATYSLVNPGVEPQVDSCQLMEGCCQYRCRSVQSRALCYCPPGQELRSDLRTCGCPNFCSLPVWARLSLFRIGTSVVTGCGSASTAMSNSRVTGRVTSVLPQSVEIMWWDGSTEEHNLCNAGGGQISLDNLQPATTLFSQLREGTLLQSLGECAVPNNGGCDHFCRSVMGMAVCSCLDGYRLGNDGRICVRDACVDNLGGCSDFCTAFPNGTRTCSCSEGFRLKQNGRDCIDVDECGTELGRRCEQRCENNVGSYRCECNQPGYQLSADLHNCSDLNECLKPSVHHCDQQCVNTRGSFFCGCDSGYELTSNERTCEDVDECFSGLGMQCQQGCRNTPGSYSCTCPRGSRLNGDNTSCSDIAECTEQRDVIINQGNCLDCLELQPGYACTQCRPGYTLTANQTWCLERDECAVDNGGCQQLCTNTEGSFLCSCFRGYDRVAFFNERLSEDVEECVNIDDCATNNGGCSHTCTDTVGSFFCSCPTGSSLGTDNRTCFDINECRVRNGGCIQGCNNTFLSFNCFCASGYDVDSTDDSNCLDVDECAVDNGGCQGNGSECVNAPGAFVCVCQRGYDLMDDVRTCEDVDECTEERDGCSQVCQNSDGSFSCGCWKGFEVSRTNPKQCIDIDECTELSPCNMTCINRRGSYYCECEHGYSLMADNSSCRDVDECTAGSHHCEQSCENLEGSYECSCLRGFGLRGQHNCSDIDECSTGAACCTNECGNTPGSYRCGCPAGFYLDDDGCTCRDIPECSANNGGCEHVCVEEEGSYRCQCNPGYAQDRYNSTQCHDINECHPAANTLIVNSSIPTSSPCGQRCRNLPGSFLCQCRELFRLRSDERTCERCPTCESFTKLESLVTTLLNEVRILRDKVADMEDQNALGQRMRQVAGDFVPIP